VPAPRPDGGRRRRRGQAGRLLDLSVTGVLVEAPAAKDLAVGSVLHMELDDHVGRVRIRRIAQSPTRGQALYGVELADVGSDLTSHIHTTLTSVIGYRTGSRLHDGASR